MGELAGVFIDASTTGPFLQGRYNPWLVLLSVAVSIFSATMALQIAGIARDTENLLYRRVAVGTGAIALGGGIWSMHFIGMLAFELPAHVHYATGLTLLSVLPAWLASWFALRLLAHPRIAWPQLAMSGTLAGLGIGTMHYSGMAAMHTPLQMRYEPVTFALSIVVAVALAILALWVRYGLRHTKMNHTQRLLAGGHVMGVSIAAMHYTGMAATRFVGEAGEAGAALTFNNVYASLALSVFTVTAMVLVYALNGLVRSRELYRQVEESRSQLRETAERAERAAAAKSTFLATMSHEIRTPMNAIVGFTELLLQSDLDTTQRSHLNTIRQSSRSLLGLINDILDTTRLEKGGLALERIDFSLRGLAFQIESSMRLAAQAKGLTLVTHYPDDMPDHFQGDPLRVLQILNNLVGNAVKFTEAGSVEVLFSREEGMVHVQVRDSGIGMTPEQAEMIFAPFTQADASISRRFGGTGLGTTIARQLVELMGGTIVVDSEPGRGSTFHVRLPLPPGHKPANPAATSEMPTLPALTILVADDVAQNIELLKLTLGDDHTVVTASNGSEALQLFTDGQFDVVLMDVHMPELDGLQAARLIRQHERQHGLKPTPIIALTASVMAEDRRTAHQAGMDGFATKPLDLPQLLDEIALVLHLPRPSRSSTTAPTADALINWAAGSALWGSEKRLAKALQQFLASAAVNYPLPTADATPDWDQLRFSLHDIRGVAGNLALPTVAALAAALEQQLRDGERESALARLPTLHQLLGAVADELQRHLPELQEQQPDPLQRADTDPIPTTELRAQIDQLQALLAHNELDDAVVLAVCRGLEQRGDHARAQALRQAIDSFEFSDAQLLLQQLVSDRVAVVS